MRPFVFALFVAAFVHAAVARADACDCPAQSQSDAFSAAVAVFEGRVLQVSPAAVEEGAPTVTAELSVVRTWKGAEHERITLRAPGDAAACAFTFARDESYVVYATEHADNLWVDRCTRTRRVADAGTDLQALGLGVTPVEPKNAAAKKPRTEPPARGGCAGCMVGATRVRAHAHGSAATWPLALLAGFALARRAHARRARARRS